MCGAVEVVLTPTLVVLRENTVSTSHLWLSKTKVVKRTCVEAIIREIDRRALLLFRFRTLCFLENTVCGLIDNFLGGSFLVETELSEISLDVCRLFYFQNAPRSVSMYVHVQQSFDGALVRDCPLSVDDV